MILVVGATGLLGEEICQRLRARGLAVRALARQTANPVRLEALRGAGVHLCWGDLKDTSSLREACFGVDAVISSASSTFSRKDGDSIETVDREGQLSLIDAARSAGMEHFTLIGSAASSTISHCVAAGNGTPKLSSRRAVAIDHTVACAAGGLRTEEMPRRIKLKTPRRFDA